MDAKQGLDHIAIYGNIRIIRRYCVDCERFALVVKGRIQCCDALVKQGPIKAQKRMSMAYWCRRLPPLKDRRRILREQEHRCFWCDRLFGRFVWRKNRKIKLRITWDHYIPFSY